MKIFKKNFLEQRPSSEGRCESRNAIYIGYFKKYVRNYSEKTRLFTKSMVFDYNVAGVADCRQKTILEVNLLKINGRGYKAYRNLSNQVFLGKRLFSNFLKLIRAEESV